MSNENLKFVQFSDSILIVVNGVDEENFKLLTKAAVHLVHAAMSRNMPVKGVIAQGIFSYDKEKELYLGRPLVDAYLLQEEIKYYGIVVHHTAEGTVKKYKNKENPYFNTPVFIEKGKTSHYHLCWNLVPEDTPTSSIASDCKKWIETISEQVSGHPRMYIDKTLEVLKNDETESENREKINKDESENQSVEYTSLPPR